MLRVAFIITLSCVSLSLSLWFSLHRPTGHPYALFRWSVSGSFYHLHNYCYLYFMLENHCAPRTSYLYKKRCAMFKLLNECALILSLSFAFSLSLESLLSTNERIARKTSCSQWIQWINGVYVCFCSDFNKQQLKYDLCRRRRCRKHRHCSNQLI